MRKLGDSRINFRGPEVGMHMHHSIISAVVGFSLVLASVASVLAEEQPLDMVDNPPGRYVVVKGDTLWGISKRFLKSPWRWPDLWGMNKDEIRNPHLIYPGNVLILDTSGGIPRLRLEGDGVAGGNQGGAVGSTVKLSPKIRSDLLSATPVPSISSSIIGPFLNRPLIVAQDQFEKAPRIVATQENRVVLGIGDSAFVKGLPADSALIWQVYRPGKPLRDPISGELLGNEVIYLGDVRVREFGEISSVSVVSARQEIGTGDRLVQAPASDVRSYMPRPAKAGMNGIVMSAADNVISEIGQQQVVVINRGAREGIEVGSVFALYRTGRAVVPRSLPRSMTNDEARKSVSSVYSENKKADNAGPVVLPDQRYGLVFVFRVFEKVSYALIMNTSRPVNLLDIVQAP